MPPLNNTQWPDNADSPVLFFIDDLSNVWIDINGDGKIQPEEDWGHAGFSSYGAFHFLEKKILSEYPEIKVTFFVPVGVREPVLKYSGINRIALKINHDESSKNFFKTIHKNPKYEIAYHGTTHGIAGRIAEDFTQEWVTFTSLEEALNTIKIGKEIFRQTLGEYPKGGKYCGYKSNCYSDESIDKSSFSWWCRGLQLALATRHCTNLYQTGSSRNPFSAFMPGFFGQNRVVDIPSTFIGTSYGNFPIQKGLLSSKNILKWILGPYAILKLRNRLRFFLKNKLVISIQEHMSPAREDLKRQSPNIFDDRYYLRHILLFLKSQRVWYCTGTELANWVSERDQTK